MNTLINRATSSTLGTGLHALAGAWVLAMAMVAGVSAQEIRLSQGAWTQVASACTVDDTGAGYDVNGAGLSFAGSGVGEILARCNVTNLMQSLVDTENCPTCRWNTLEVVYRDPDGGAVANRVTATLHAVSNNGLAERPLVTLDPITGRPVAIFDPSQIVQFDSNTVPTPTTAAVQTRAVGFTHDFNFEDNAYYILLKVKRSKAGPGNNPTVFVVRLLYRTFSG